MPYKLPLEQPLPVNVFDLADGPFILGSTQTQQYVDRWAAWVAGQTIRLGKWVPGMVLDNVAGQRDDLFIDYGPELSPGGSWASTPVPIISVTVVAGARYSWVKGANESELINGSPLGAEYFASQEFVAVQSTVAVLGVPGGGVPRTFSLKRQDFVRPSKLSLCFEQSALPVIAVQKDPTTIEIRRKVSSIVNSYVFAGLSPVLFYNGVSIIDTSVTDAVCLYAKAPGDKIFARAQRDNFGVEYVINAAIAPGATIKELRKTDRRNIGGVNYQALWGVATDGRQLYFRSAAYPPLPQYPVDKLTNDVALDASAYASGVAGATAPGDKATTDATIDSGIYLGIVVAGAAPSDKATTDASADSGVYFFAVIAGPAPTDKATTDATFDSGIYFFQVIFSTSPTDKVTTDTGLDSGQYV